MFKKLACIVLAALCVCGISFALPLSAGAADPAPSAEEERPRAIFLQSVTMTEEGENALFSCLFDKEVSEKAGDLDAKAYFKFNGKSLSDISGSTLAYTENAKEIVASVPKGELGDGTVRMNVLGGFISETECVTTVRYIYDFYGAGAGNRIYRSDNMDDYEEVTVTSISVPTVESLNSCIYIYFSDAVTPKKYHDLQWTRSWLISAYGENNKQHPDFSNSELNLLYNYQVYDPQWDFSIAHTLLFGCEDYNGLKAYPANTGNIDMTPKETVGDIELFDMRQIQESVAQEGVPYLDVNGQPQTRNGSTQPLSVQIHFDENWIQFILKGDARADADLGTVLDAAGEKVEGYPKTFNENLRPDFNQVMAIKVAKGMLLPNGKMVKQDFTFLYNPERKYWRLADSAQAEYREDETLSNQQGYTDAELAQLAKNQK